MRTCVVHLYYFESSLDWQEHIFEELALYFLTSIIVHYTTYLELIYFLNKFVKWTNI